MICHASIESHLRYGVILFSASFTKIFSVQKRVSALFWVCMLGIALGIISKSSAC